MLIFGIVLQIIILMSNVFIIWCLSSPNTSLQRMGHIVGIVSSPAWVITTFLHGQFGMFVLTFWYMFCYYRGLKNTWSNVEKKEV